MIRLEQALIRLAADLRALDLRWALIGGLAVSVRAEPRTTRDLDVAVAVSGDAESERITLTLKMRGYQPFPAQPFLEDHGGRLSMVRLLVPGFTEEDGVVADLLFSSSGIEEEVASAAEAREVLPGVYLPVATIGHLVALKVLAGRDKDRADARMLLERATPEDLRQTRGALELITRRGFHRGKELDAVLDLLLEPEG